LRFWDYSTSFFSERWVVAEVLADRSSHRKSKAKLFDEKERIQVTFKDVAGLEGAKEEVGSRDLKNSEKYTKLGGKIPKGVLLVGLREQVKLIGKSCCRKLKFRSSPFRF
jgi:ATP-dependent Zn protease